MCPGSRLEIKKENLGRISNENKRRDWVKEDLRGENDRRRHLSEKIRRKETSPALSLEKRRSNVDYTSANFSRKFSGGMCGFSNVFI